MPDPIVVAEQAGSPAPDPAETAAAVPEVVTPEVPPEATPKTFTQEELDAILERRLAKEQRKWERKLAQAQPTIPQIAEAPEPGAEITVEQKAHELLARRIEEQQRSELIEAYTEREEAVREKYDDYEQVAYNPTLPVTEVMAETIRASDMGPELLYHLGTNPKEALRIARLSPFLQAKEIGRMEAKLAADPPKKKTSTAPAPIAPVNARGGSEKSFDTTDPRSIAAMTTSEWIAADRARQIKKMQGQIR